MEQNTKSGGGRTLVNGTGYDIKLGPQNPVLTIENAANENSGYVVIGSTAHYGPESIEVPSGTSVTVQIFAYGVTWEEFAIYFNGSSVQSGRDSESGLRNKWYTFTMATDCSIRFTDIYGTGSGNRYGSNAYITT